MKKQSWILASFFMLAGFILASCGTTAHVEKDKSVNFNQYQTYAWIQPNATQKNKPADIMESTVKNIVSEELQKNAGWREVSTSSNPDLLLSYDILVERAVREKNDARYSRPFVRTFYNPMSRRYFNVYYPSQFMGYENYSVPTQEGTVTVSMIDAKTDKTVWQGWTTDEIDSRRIKSKEVQAAVKSIFRKFDLAKN